MMATSLRELALQASQGEFYLERAYHASAANGGYYSNFLCVKFADGMRANVADICDSYNMTSEQSQANAEFYEAANPAAILSLLDERDALREALKGYVDDMGETCKCDTCEKGRAALAKVSA